MTLDLTSVNLYFDHVIGRLKGHVIINKPGSNNESIRGKSLKCEHRTVSLRLGQKF